MAGLGLLVALGLGLGLNIYIQPPDSVYYFGVARSLVLDGDLSFADEVLDFDFPPNQFYVTEQAHLANDWPIGAGLVWTPLYALGHLAARIAPDHPAAAVPGAGPWERAVTALGIIALALGGLVLTWNTARGLFGSAAASMATVAAVAGGPLLFYILCFPHMSHVTSFAAIALFVWGWHTTRGRRTTSQWILLGLLWGWLGLIRPQNAVCGVMWAVEWFGEARARGRTDRRSWVVGLGLAVLAAAFASLPQVLLWAKLYGHPLQLPKIEEMHWLRPRVFSMLFSDFHGLLVWSPAWALAFLGVGLLIRRDRVLGWSVAAVLALQVYLNAANEVWWAGGSFSNRRFADHTAFAILAMVPLLAAPRLRWAAGVLAALATAWALLLLWAERAGHITLDHYMIPREMRDALAATLGHPIASSRHAVGNFGGFGPTGRVALLASAALIVSGLWAAGRRLPARWRSARGLLPVALAAQTLVIVGVGVALLRTPRDGLHEDFIRAPRHNASLWNSFYEYGYHCGMKGNLEESRRAYRRAADLWPAYAQPYRYLGQIAWRQGDPVTAIAHLEHALTLDPDYASARRILGQYRQALATPRP